MKTHMKKFLLLATVVIFSALPCLPVYAAGWTQDTSGWWYSREDGSYPRSEWAQINGRWYYFDQSGYMKTGWLRINGAQYYLHDDGIMNTGWLFDGGEWYYFNNSGAMVRGWQNLGNWYYFDSEGTMICDEWVGEYYLTGDGTMARNMEVDGVWLGSDGRKSNNYSVIAGTTGGGSKSSDRVSLASLEHFNGKPNWTTGGEDCLGNSFGTSLLLEAKKLNTKNPSIYSTTPPLEYYLNGEYGQIKGILAFNKKNSKNRTPLMMQIYADDELVYESEGIDEKTEPISFDVDVEYAQYIKILVTNTKGESSSNSLIISNVILYN